jgi:hypothetical protein
MEEGHADPLGERSGQMIKQQHQMSTNEQSNPLVLCFAHVFRWVSAKCRDFHIFGPPRDTVETLLLSSSLEGEITLCSGTRNGWL